MILQTPNIIIIYFNISYNSGDILYFRVASDYNNTFSSNGGTRILFRTSTGGYLAAFASNNGLTGYQNNSQMVVYNNVNATNMELRHLLYNQPVGAELKIYENVALNNFKSSNFFEKGLVNERKIKEHSKKLLSDFSVNTDNVELKSQFLSGGNLQKLILGRELITAPELLICYNPTWGLDVGAINYIHETLIKINDQEKSTILISTDTEELLKLSDRIAVIYKGKLSKIMPSEEVTPEKLGLLMGGGSID
mgnify:CR=1 FL=1